MLRGGKWCRLWAIYGKNTSIVKYAVWLSDCGGFTRQNQNQKYLLVTRQNDNHSPGYPSRMLSCCIRRKWALGSMVQQ